MQYFAERYIWDVLVRRKQWPASPTPSNYLQLSHFTDSIDESWGKWTHNYAHLSYINTASWHLSWTLSCHLFVWFNWKLMVTALPRQPRHWLWVASSIQTDTSGIVCPVWPWKSEEKKKGRGGQKRHYQENREVGVECCALERGGKIK